MRRLIQLFAIATIAGFAASQGDPLVQYLNSFGYINLGADKLVTDDALRTGLQNLQKYYGLPVTGTFDKATEELVNASRCGMPDIENGEDMFMFNSSDSMVNPDDSVDNLAGIRDSRWLVPDLKYHVINMNEISRKTLREAFDFWQKETSFTFQEVSDIFSADIIASFENRKHNKINVALGKKQVSLCTDLGYALAHASYPRRYETSLVHANIASDWRQNDFWRTMVHELGHTLGLRHNNRKDSIMFPINLNGPRITHLAPVDRDTIVKLYPTIGQKRQQRSDGRKPTVDRRSYDVEPKHRVAVESTFVVNGQMYVFRQEKVWSKDNPKGTYIHHTFKYPNLISNVQSAGINENGDIFLITPTEYMRFDPYSLEHINSVSLSELIDSPTGTMIGESSYIVEINEIPTRLFKLENDQGVERLVASVEILDTLADIQDAELNNVYELNGATRPIQLVVFFITTMTALALSRAM